MVHGGEGTSLKVINMITKSLLCFINACSYLRLLDCIIARCCRIQFQKNNVVLQSPSIGKSGMRRRAVFDESLSLGERSSEKSVTCLS
jgi:hypothetical protein